ncbi:reverse transcriptase RNA-dependent DNA polymerase [Nitzschia inconspicua]|uniref:Reverse transcriptase RNA-dependent DNA polymerase n=1 Tax=Nitzschia inconspicua TaxID=303405 RepID=A0A9K3P8U7_9STRA|nr:reverse transcriptase RNA-dependent DNA polymerase [Nitzschia inconspicua]KAG7353056.1 reverse transcriptase RNA-dependent DNA polymerase [Nitzschia inconspicua]
MFKKGIKRDHSLFPTLKAEELNDDWHRKFEIQAHAQGVAHVVDSEYSPSTPEEKEVFELIQTFMYAVLESKVQTSSGKLIVRKHQAKKDAQAAYAALMEHHRQSVVADIKANQIMAYLTTSTIGDGKFKGTTSEFIAHWSDQVRQYETIKGESSAFNDNEKIIHLSRAVATISELRQVKIVAEWMRTSTKDPIEFQRYYELLSAAAAQYDDSLSHKPKRLIYSHVIDQDWGDPFWEVDESYNIDTPISHIEANAHVSRSRKQRGPSMGSSSNRSSQRILLPKEVWHTLSDEFKVAWGNLSEEEKAMILSTRLPSNNPRVVQLHEQSQDADMEEEFQDAVADSPVETAQSNDQVQVHNAQQQSAPKFPPYDIRVILSSKGKQASTLQAKMCITSTPIVYRVSSTSVKSKQSLIDRGANGGIAGQDCKVICISDRTVDVQGIDNHQLNSVSIGTAAGYVESNKGPVILILHQYALVGRGHSIHSPGQLEWFKHSVCDKSVHVGGLQRIKTADGYVIPIAMVHGLPLVRMRPPTDKEFNTLPHIVMTSDSTWDPSVLDFDHEEEDDQWFDAIEHQEAHPYSKLFDEYGNYRRRVTIKLSDTLCRPSTDPQEHLIDQCIVHANCERELFFFDAQSHSINETSPLVAPSTPRTLQHTTQLARTTTGTLLKKVYRSQNPALNVIQRGEPVATDELFSDTPAIDCGATQCQVFVGMNTDVTDVYPLQTSKQFVNSLEDNVRFRGAPTKLVSDQAPVEISGRALEFLRVYGISTWHSEPHQQHQNYAERKIQQLKQMANTIMDRTGAPANTWLLCLMYVAFLLNHTWSDNIKAVPLTALLGVTVDTSVLLRYHFWQPVYFKAVEPSFPSATKEHLGHVVGISEHVGHALTWKVLDSTTNKVLHRSLLRPVTDTAPNFRLATLGGEDPSSVRPTIFSKSFDQPDDGTKLDNPVDESTNDCVINEKGDALIQLSDLVGMTFLMDPQPDGQIFRARVVEMIENHDNELESNPDRIKFLCRMDKDGREDLLTYNQVLDYLNRDMENPVLWKYKRIVSHQGPLKQGDKDYKGSAWNVLLEWETGEVTAEPLNIIAKDDPITCAIYAKENGLLNTEGWKRFKTNARREKKFTRMVKQAFLRSFRSSPKYKYGHEIPQSYEDALRLDRIAGNTKWQDAVGLELGQIHEYKSFENLGHKDKVSAPKGYKKIRVHLVFDVKHDGRFKAWLVADGHLTDAPLESVYSGVVSMRGFRMVMFLAELNDLAFWSTDVGNTYLESYTTEKVYIIAGPEFKDLEGHILIISKALYGLKSSGQRWHDRLHDCLLELGWFPCKAEPDIWMRKNGELNVWEYIAVYVDDLAIAMQHPQELIDQLTSKPFEFKLKGTGEISHHLGMQFSRDEDGTLCMEQRKYLEKMIDGYIRFFGSKPRTNACAPLERGDHPEMDTTPFLDEEKTKMYQSLIGALQWIITIGRFDVFSAVTTMSSFRAAPREGHLERVKRIYSYLHKMSDGKIRVRVEEPDYSGLPNFEFDWSRTVYGFMSELLPDDAPEPLGKWVTLTHFVDANLMHDLVTGRSLTGILHLLNKTPIDWYSKKQATVETATYGSEMVAMRTCVEQVVDLRNTLRYLGVPIREKSYVFGDNESVINSCAQLHAKLHKRHNMLSFHYVREAIATGFLHLTHIPGKINPADMLSKHWGYSDVKDILKALLFQRGNTAETDQSRNTAT